MKDKGYKEYKIEGDTNKKSNDQEEDFDRVCVKMRILH